MTATDLARVTALTFDCYGTLIDWEAGATEALRPLLARHGVTPSDDEIVRAFQDIDAELCEPPYRPYRAVLAGVVEGGAAGPGLPGRQQGREAAPHRLAQHGPDRHPTQVGSAHPGTTPFGAIPWFRSATR